MRLPPKSYLDCRRDLNFVGVLVRLAKLGLIFYPVARKRPLPLIFPFLPPTPSVYLSPIKKKILMYMLIGLNDTLWSTPTYQVCSHYQLGGHLKQGGSM